MKLVTKLPVEQIRAYCLEHNNGIDPQRLKGLSEATIQKTLADLATIGCIRLYTVEGESYFCFPNWSVHQRVQTKKSKFPAPVENINPPLSTVTHGESPPESNPIRIRIQSKRRGVCKPGTAGGA